MGMHDRAWEGFKILILAKAPMQAMRIEQAIAEAAPAIEVQLSSFESYDEAYKFCKEQKNVGFFFLHENCGETSFLNVFRELASQYEGSGLPALGTVLFDKEPNAFAQKAIGKNNALIDYIPVKNLLEPGLTFPTLQNTWMQYIEAFENIVLPKALQSSLISMAEEQIGIQEVHFIQRLTTNLISELNVSWIESVAIRWTPILKQVKINSEAFLKPHPLFSYFLELCRCDEAIKSEDLFSFLQSKTQVCKKVTRLVEFLDERRSVGDLYKTLEFISALNKAGSPKLVRHIAKNRERILQFESDANAVDATGTYV